MGAMRILLATVFAALVSVPSAQAGVWHKAYVTGYSTRENLTGCYSPGKCRTACGVNLDDSKFWVAANPRWGLGCGQKIIICNKGRCVKAVVMDRTASRFDFEFTYALALATGAPKSYPAFADPRWITWRKA